MKKKILSCWFCGAPISEDFGEHLPIPDNYDPNDYEHGCCYYCNQEEIQRQRQKKLEQQEFNN